MTATPADWKNANVRGLRNALRRWVDRRNLASSLDPNSCEDTTTIVATPPVTERNKPGPKNGSRQLSDGTILKVLRAAYDKSGATLDKDVFPKLVDEEGNRHHQRENSLRGRIRRARDLDEGEKKKALEILKQLSKPNGSGGT